MVRRKDLIWKQPVRMCCFRGYVYSLWFLWGCLFGSRRGTFMLKHIAYVKATATEEIQLSTVK
jgi:hypothetical protein